MADPTSVEEIDLRPIPGKKYFDTTREWREEFIYFLMVDRFHDDTPRPVVTSTGRSSGIQTPNLLLEIAFSTLQPRTLPQPLTLQKPFSGLSNFN